MARTVQNETTRNVPEIQADAAFPSCGGRVLTPRDRKYPSPRTYLLDRSSAACRQRRRNNARDAQRRWHHVTRLSTPRLRLGSEKYDSATHRPNAQCGAFSLRTVFGIAFRIAIFLVPLTSRIEPGDGPSSFTGASGIITKSVREQRYRETTARSGSTNSLRMRHETRRRSQNSVSAVTHAS